MTKTPILSCTRCVKVAKWAWWCSKVRLCGCICFAARTNRVSLEICADPLGSEGSESANDAELNILREKVKFLRVAKILAKCNFEHLNDEGQSCQVSFG